MDLRTRICLTVIVAGLANFLAFTIVTLTIGGDAKNGKVELDAGGEKHFYVGMEGRLTEVSRGMWIASALHSLSIWFTHAAVLLSTILLAKEHLESQMSESMISGKAFVWAFILVVVAASFSIAGFFLRDFVASLRD